MATQQRAPRKPRGLHRQRQFEAPSVNEAHRAIVTNDKSLAEISDMVKVAPGESPFGSDRFLDDLPEPQPKAPVGFWDMRVGVFSYRGAMGLTMAIGAVGGVPLGILLHGTAVHHAISSVFPFL